jgi:hypothetical protein
MLSEQLINRLNIAAAEIISSGIPLTNKVLRLKTSASYDEATAFFNEMIRRGELIRVGASSKTHYIRVHK